MLTAVRGRYSWLLSTVGGPAHDHGRNSSHDSGVREVEEWEKESEREPSLSEIFLTFFTNVAKQPVPAHTKFSVQGTD